MIEEKNFPKWLFKQNIDDLAFLEDMAVLPPKELQQKYFPDSEDPVGATSRKFQRIKNRVRNYRWIINNILNLEKKSKYVKRKLMYAEAPTDEDLIGPEM